MSIVVATPAVPARYAVIPVVPGSLNFSFVAPSVITDGIQVNVTGREIILIQNVNAGAQTVTVASARDEYGRLGDISAYSLAAGAFMCLPLGSAKLFGNTNGAILITMSHVDIKVAVLQLINQLF